MAMEIRVIDFVERVVVTSDDRRWPISDLFDRSGLSTQDHRAAVIGVAGGPGAWLSFKVGAFERRGLQ